MIKVYIACPYTKGNKADNVHNSMLATNQLINCGYSPFNPLLYHFQHIFAPKDNDTWMDIDMEWLKVSDCVLRLPGESDGAEKEVEEALILGIPVFNSIKEILFAYEYMHTDDCDNMGLW